MVGCVVKILERKEAKFDDSLKWMQGQFFKGRNNQLFIDDAFV